MSAYWRQLVASPAEQRRGQALSDGIDQLRRATAALQAASEDERDSGRVETLKRAIADVAGARRALEALQ